MRLLTFVLGVVATAGWCMAFYHRSEAGFLEADAAREKARADAVQ
jgi:hypothetical protein